MSVPPFPDFPTALTQSPERITFTCLLAGKERGWPAKSSTWAAPSLILQHGEQHLLGLINATSTPVPGFEYRQLLDRVYNISDSHAFWKSFGVLLSAYRAHASNCDKDFYDYLLKKESKQNRNRTANCVDALVILMNAAPSVLIEYMGSPPFRWNWLGRAGAGKVECFRDPVRLEKIVVGALERAKALERPLENAEFEALINELMEPSVLPLRNWSADPEVSQYAQPGISWPKQDFMGTVCPCTIFFCGQAGSGKTNCARSWLEHMSGAYTKVYLAAKDGQQPIYREMVQNQGRHGFSVQATDFEQLEAKHYAEGNGQPTQQKLLWCDDQIGASYPKSLVQMANTGRHSGWSTWILSQSFTELNIEVRRGMNYYILKQMGSVDDVKLILRQRNLPKEAVDWYRAITVDKANFFMIDMVGGNETRFRKNWTPIAALRQRLEQPISSSPMDVDGDDDSPRDEMGIAAVHPLLSAPEALVASPSTPSPTPSPAPSSPTPVLSVPTSPVSTAVVPTPIPTAVLPTTPPTASAPTRAARPTPPTAKADTPLRALAIADDIWQERKGAKDRGAWRATLEVYKDALSVEDWEEVATLLTERCVESRRDLLKRNLRDEFAEQQFLSDGLVDVQMTDLVHLDLLCGTGAFSIGFENACREAGVRGQTVLCLDKAENAVSACRLNFPRARTVRATLDASFNTTALPYATVVSAGVPCPDFSKNRSNGQRHLPDSPQLKGATDRSINVFDTLVRLAAGENRPRVFVLENVANLIEDAENKAFLDGQLDRFGEHGYHRDYFILDTQDFKLPQSRSRVFIVLFKDSIAGWERPVPPGRLTRPWFPDLLDPHEVLNGHTCWVGVDEDGKPEIKPHLPEQQLHVRQHGVMFGHDSRHKAADNEWVNKCGTPGLSCCLIESFGNARSNRPVVLDGREGETPRWRYLTARECANFHGFPASYQIDPREGYTPTRHTVENRGVSLMGNAVSPPVAQAVIASVLDCIARQGHDPLSGLLSGLSLGEEEKEATSSTPLRHIGITAEEESDDMAQSSSSFFSANAAFSSQTDDWATPQATFDALNAEFHFSLDPCASDSNHKCARYFTVERNGLEQNWGTEVVFMNPPYGRTIGQWMKKAYESSQAGATVVALIPSRTGTKWWHEYAIKGEVRFLQGRLRFGAAVSSAPFDSAVVVFRPPA